jgi:hypothetical protein
MLVEICFIRVDGDRWERATDHHTEMLDTGDEKAIQQCWQTVSDKFQIPLATMVVFEGYLTFLPVLPTCDDLQRIWLSYLQESDDQVDTDQDHLCLRFFVAKPPIPPTILKPLPLPLPLPLPVPLSDQSDIKQGSPILPPSAGDRVETWVQLLETVNGHAAVLLPKHKQDELKRTDLFLRGMAAMTRSWYLFAVARVDPTQVQDLVLQAGHNLAQCLQLFALVSQFIQPPPPHQQQQHQPQQQQQQQQPVASQTIQATYAAVDDYIRKTPAFDYADQKQPKPTAPTNTATTTKTTTTTTLDSASIAATSTAGAAAASASMVAATAPVEIRSTSGSFGLSLGK